MKRPSYQFINTWAIALLLLLGYGQVMGQAETEELLKEGHTAYAAQEYRAAIEAYEAVLEQGNSHALIHYNLGNAYYKSRNIPGAILQYERALKLDPSLEDAQFNLKLARMQVVDKIEPRPRFIVAEWASTVFMGRSSGQWGSWALILLWMALAFGGLFILAKIPGMKRLGFFGGLVLLTLAISSTLIGFNKKSVEQNSGAAIIMSPNAYIKNAPGGDQDLLILHAGTKVEVLETMDAWSRIRIEGVSIGEVVGFVQTETMELI